VIMLRTMRREWKAMLAAACGLVGLVALVHEGYRVLVYGMVRPIPGLPSLYRLYCRLAADSGCLDMPLARISWNAHPILFVINLAVLLPGVALLAALAPFVVWQWRTEQRNLGRRDSRPPMDRAIRESVKR